MSATRCRQRGVTLVELMAAMTIGLVITLGATTLYVNSRRTTDTDDAIARLQETARYALSVIENDVRMANYWGLTKDGADFENKDANNGNAGTATALAVALVGSCGAVFATNTEVYAAAVNNNYTYACGAFNTATNSADTLTVRRTESAIAPASDARLQVCTTRKTATMIRDSLATCPGGEIHNLITNAYYVDRSSEQGNGVPSLRRKTLGTAGGVPAFGDVEIVPGVEDMQIELGWDNNNTATSLMRAVRYVQPGNAVLAGGRIVAVRVWLLVRAETPDTAYRDIRTYTYADRTGAVVSNLHPGGGVGADGARYAPNDNFRRILVSRTYFIRNATGT